MVQELLAVLWAAVVDPVALAAVIVKQQIKAEPVVLMAAVVAKEDGSVIEITQLVVDLVQVVQ